ncbi:haloacid dehalogenase type II [Haloterrigena sp. SYSU A558-1]|uniref:Haloacid dehalogenase type II n=1 Tax=Haloterrigena gelatinilytica TaxID=2741724 RepID=A0ABX2L5S9_9EURY|nr:haloacid dehalogenase type II [Haloterrigena gelatinilytica]NUC71607.1 haloacid dehalogenase type II [Haloterrigena gelatinilytica]
MSFDPDAVETLAFDSYGTLVDVAAVAEPISERVDEFDPSLVAKIWRQRSLANAMVGNAIGEYDAFYEMNRNALRVALETVGVELDADEREEILSTYHELPVFDDVRDGMERFRNLGYDCYVVSNGNEEMLESLVEGADLGDVLEDAISADEIEQFKPQPELYRHAADEIGTPIEEIAFVAAGWWDVPGAMNAGMQGVWINRSDTLWGPYETEPDLTIDSFHDLAEELEAD